jgi:hypothetical protein
MPDPRQDKDLSESANRPTAEASQHRGIMTTAPPTVPIRREPELAGQIVVVIGGSAGIGLETARRARAEGADIDGGQQPLS